ncbi:carbonic anhydrase 14 isoform X2 [Polyodon spathula]|uniref:carbonic anhydrase 14 isoform X2 n=1 Tax=Polyodon spathula TaxID=7913 RepID=UPI001B7F4786|nr:carbonic anhydrase 14 isoform X2 [Polyodon spathula]
MRADPRVPVLRWLFFHLLSGGGLLQIQAVGDGPHWTHTGSHGQSHWAELFPSCGGLSQSPVNIETGCVKLDPSLHPIEPQGYSSPSSDFFTLENNGHSVEMSLPGSMSLSRRFTAAQLHLHWGSGGNGAGSEHLIDWQASPAELHVVHFNSEKYPNVSVARNQSDGLAVLGILIEVGEETNPAYEKIFNYLGYVKYAGQKVLLPSFDVGALLPERLDRFFRYNGSLTTPPCFQSVQWTVFHQKVSLSRSQIEKLRTTLLSSELGVLPPTPLVDNFRAPQPLNQRVVLVSFPLDARVVYSIGEIFAVIAGILFGALGIILTAHFLIKGIRSKKHREPKQEVIYKACNPEEEVVQQQEQQQP